VSESLVKRLAHWLQHDPVVVASVLATRGATPRKVGSHMLIRERDDLVDTYGSIGGGEAEARVIAEALCVLEDGLVSQSLTIELDGSREAAGICGGRMQLLLRRWASSAAQQRANDLANRLAAGEAVELDQADPSERSQPLTIEPDPRLLIVGGGHCGLALYELARHLDFELCVFDEREEFAHAGRFPDAMCISGHFDLLQHALDTRRRVFAALLSRDFHTDLAALEQLAHKPPDFIGMMGSARRIHQVRTALSARLGAEHLFDFARIRAPIGLDIGAHTPHEIAVSVLAELIAFRHLAE
jgi:xanthine dehydrogenase accessory factor